MTVARNHEPVLVRRTAREISRPISFRQAGDELLRDEMSPRQFIESLVAARKYADAIRVVAHVLPRRAAVWWNVVCLWDSVRPTPPALVAEIIESSVQWVLLPIPEHQRPLRNACRAARRHKAAQSLALAVSYAGETLLPELPTLPAKTHLTAKLTAASVLIAAADAAASQRIARQRQYLELGVEIAQRKNLWLPVSELQRAHYAERSNDASPGPRATPVAVA